MMRDDIILMWFVVIGSLVLVGIVSLIGIIQ
jgi:hypothetical protein